MSKAARANSIASLPLYNHFFQAQKERRPKDTGDVDKLFPMRLSAVILNINKDGTIGFRWMNDDRSLKKFSTALNMEYAKKKDCGTLRLAEEVLEGTVYGAFLESDGYHGYYRCQILDLYGLNKTTNRLALIDHGVIIEVPAHTVDLFYHEDKANDEDGDEHDRYPYAGFCCLADKNQCEQIGAATFDNFTSGEEVELFLLSSKEPYYAVASSLRNPETKIVEAALVHDLSSEFAETWNLISMNHFEAEPAVRPTMAFSPKWIHGYNPVMVTVPHIQSLEKVAACDLLCSLRSCILSEYLLYHYSKPEVKQALQVTNPMVQLGVGVIVVAHDLKTHKYHRAQITELNFVSNYASLVGLDSPNWISLRHSFNDLWLLSKTIELFPRQFHNLPINRALDKSYEVKTMLAEVARAYCTPNSVALVQCCKENPLDVYFGDSESSLLTKIGLDGIRFNDNQQSTEVQLRPIHWKSKMEKESEVKVTKGFSTLAINKDKGKEAGAGKPDATKKPAATGKPDTTAKNAGDAK